MSSGDFREVVRRVTGDVSLEQLLPRRHLVAVIGIDDYACLPRLRCAVSDALGMSKLFLQMGFEAPIPPLLDRAATKPAIESLVEDQLRKILQPDDALILFFAGHGTTRLAELEHLTVETGYLCPAEARSAEHFGDLINMEEMLKKIALLPARHILVVLDACHSGMALGTAAVQYRSVGRFVRSLIRNRSRRVITSARRDEPALDSGPVPGHSLFTGALIQSIVSGVADIDENGFITFSELALRLQQAVGQASGSRQTPDYGAFHLDDRGELVLAAKPGALARSDAPAWAPLPPPGPPLPASAARGRAWMIPAAVGGVVLTAGIVLSITRPWDTGSKPPPPPSPQASIPSVAPSSSPPPRASAIAPAAPPPLPRGTCPEEMIAVRPKDPVWIGSRPGVGDDDERPRWQYPINPYCIGKTEVATAEFARCVAAGKCTEPAAHAECNKAADRPNHPVNCVDLKNARTYCVWRGHRLPTEEEWEVAARGHGERLHPWGDEPPRDQLCWNGPGNDRGLQKRESTCPVGFYPSKPGKRGDESELGALDMAGNVKEWTSSSHCKYLEILCATSRSVLRGGDWQSSDASEMRGADRTAASSTAASPRVGFRCARSL
jgi:formylglycine-generating enzyme required for sulfatase activity